LIAKIEVCKQLKCDDCDETNNAATAKLLADWLSPVLLDLLCLGDFRKEFLYGEEKGHWEQEGRLLSDWVSDLIPEVNFADEVVSELIDIEAGSLGSDQGDSPVFDDTANYILRDIYPDEEIDWTEVIETLNSRSRYFNEAASKFFEKVFEGLEEVSGSDGATAGPAVYTMPIGARVWRARSDVSLSFADAQKEPLKNLGPPSSELASGGRMNAPGVSTLYAAFDYETALAEIRPSIGGTSIVACFETTSDVKVLDFQRLEGAFALDSLSVFQEGFVDRVRRNFFLKSLHRRISKPVLPKNEKEYLVTQVMAEYLQLIHASKIEGVIFNSVQRIDGLNLVMFRDSEGNFPVGYVDESMREYFTDSIEFTHSEKHKFDPSLLHDF